MSFLTRPASALRSAALRPALSSIPRARPQVRFATQDYGSGDGNPAGEKPAQQGKNRSEHLEHPGPPPPKVAEGQSSSSPNNDDSKSSSKSDSSASKSDGSKSTKGAQPKIVAAKPPSKENESEDVRKHNEAMENRTEKMHQQASSEDTKDEKVDKEYWAGKLGRVCEGALLMVDRQRRTPWMKMVMRFMGGCERIAESRIHIYALCMDSTSTHDNFQLHMSDKDAIEPRTGHSDVYRHANKCHPTCLRQSQWSRLFVHGLVCVMT
jgi:hypothetical protein